MSDDHWHRGFGETLPPKEKPSFDCDRLLPVADDDPKNRVALFQKREIRRTMHHGEWWFVITDVIAALTDSADPSGYWKTMRKRDPDLSKALQGGDNLSPPLPSSSRRPRATISCPKKSDN